MQRVRIGIMGLAGVFLLVVLSAALYSLFGARPQAGAGPDGNSADNSVEAPRDPLAELGVAPGNGPSDTKSPPPPAPRSKPAPTR